MVRTPGFQPVKTSSILVMATKKYSGCYAEAIQRYFGNIGSGVRISPTRQNNK